MFSIFGKVERAFAIAIVILMLVSSSLAIPNPRIADISKNLEYTELCFEGFLCDPVGLFVRPVEIMEHQSSL